MAKKTTRKIVLIVSDEKTPKVRLKPGQKLEVVQVMFADPDLKKAPAVAARLCDSTDTCQALAIID
jgi:hypothetical protein